MTSARHPSPGGSRSADEKPCVFERQICFRAQLRPCLQAQASLESGVSGDIPLGPCWLDVRISQHGRVRGLPCTARAMLLRLRTVPDRPRISACSFPNRRQYAVLRTAIHAADLGNPLACHTLGRAPARFYLKLEFFHAIRCKNDLHRLQSATNIFLNLTSAHRTGLHSNRPLAG